ncbi:MAG TPA: hypothetical protein DD727_06775 [Clostridiales bacterium]|nr:hypothetical protein [Clostridiales bacterium]
MSFYGITYNREAIKNMVQDLNLILGTRVSFTSHDLVIWISYPNMTDFCTLIKTDEGACERCRQSDREAIRLAASTGHMQIHPCHAGLTEAYSPIIHDGRILGYLMLGQVLTQPPTKELWDELKKRFTHMKIDLGDLEEAFYRLNWIPVEKIQAAARLIDMSAKFILIDHMARIREPGMIDRIVEYTEKNLARPIRIHDLSNHLDLSISYVSHVIKDHFGRSFTEYLNMKRLEKARELLENTKDPVIKISAETGISDPNYFSRLFKKYTGLSPSQCRNRYGSPKTQKQKDAVR